MLVLEYKAVVKKPQVQAIEEAIRTSQFIRNKVLRYWMDNRGVGKKELYQYNTQLRAEYEFARDLNSHACQASVENVERAINRFFENCKKNKPGKKGYPQFKKRGIYARKHLRVTRQRNEHAKRLARNLCLAFTKCSVSVYAKIVLEDLNISGLVKNHKLAKSISDASWDNFRQWLEHFGERFGREIIAVTPHFTSQECSNCGTRVVKSLSTRTHVCPHCGHVEQRDANAAKVILKRGKIKPTGGHSESNAWGDVSSTFVGGNTCKGKKRR